MRILLTIVAVSLLIYWPVTSLGFVSDDNGLITHPVTGIANQSVSSIFASDLWHFQETQSGYYRPLMMLSLLVDTSIFGDRAWGFHLHSLLWHLGCVWMIGVLFGRLLGQSRGNLVAGFYAFHPLVSEQVAFISARNDSMALALGLGALWCCSPTKLSTSRCLAGSVLATAACLSKETGVVVLCMLPLIDWARNNRFTDWQRYAALMTGITAAYFVREMIGPGVMHTPSLPGAELVANEKIPILATTLGKLTWPFPLTDSIHIAYMPALSVTSSITTLFLLVYLGTMGGRWGKIGVLFAVTSIVPGLMAIASRFLIGERYLTLAVLGLAISLASVMPKNDKSAWLFLLFIPWVLGTTQRIPNWSSDLTLAQSAYDVQKTPYTAAWLGHEMNKAGDPIAAKTYFDESTRGIPPTCDFAGEWIRSTREQDGNEAALQTANLVWSRKCAGAPGVRGEWAMTHLENHDLEAASQILTPRPTSCSPSIAVPVIALTLLEGGVEQAKLCAKTSGVPQTILQPKVDALLQRIITRQNTE